MPSINSELDAKIRSKLQNLLCPDCEVGVDIDNQMCPKCKRDMTEDIKLKKQLIYDDEKPFLQYLNNPEIQYHNLNQGHQNGAWYFGKLFDIKGTLTDGIITSDKKLMLNTETTFTKNGEKYFTGKNEIKKFGLNYRHSLEVNKNFWSNKSIKEYINSDAKIDKQKMFDKIRNQFVKYMDISDDAIYDAVTCWVIATYCYEMFETFGYLFFSGMSGSGKSKFKKLVRLMGFNGMEASSISEASFFRCIENTKGVLCLDEYERMDSERKKATDLLLNAGIERGASVKRVEKIGEKQLNRDFDVYCPKVICCITGLNPVTESRCIKICLAKTSTEKGNLKVMTNDNIWQPIRDGCYQLIMDHWKELKEIYDTYDCPVNNRYADIWYPIFVIGHFLGIDESVISLAQNTIKNNINENIERDNTYKILKGIAQSYLVQEQPQIFHISDIMGVLDGKIDYGQKNPERVIGWHLSNLNIFHKSRDSEGITYKLDINSILTAFISRGYPIPDKYKKYVEKLHPTTETTENSVDNVVNAVNVAKKVCPQTSPKNTEEYIHNTTHYTLPTLTTLTTLNKNKEMTFNLAYDDLCKQQETQIISDADMLQVVAFYDELKPILLQKGDFFEPKPGYICRVK